MFSVFIIWECHTGRCGTRFFGSFTTPLELLKALIVHFYRIDHPLLQQFVGWCMKNAVKRPFDIWDDSDLMLWSYPGGLYEDEECPQEFHVVHHELDRFNETTFGDDAYNDKSVYDLLSDNDPTFKFVTITDAHAQLLYKLAQTNKQTFLDAFKHADPIEFARSVLHPQRPAICEMAGVAYV